jgi:hypothetical protein
MNRRTRLMAVLLAAMLMSGCRSPEVIHMDRGDPQGVGYKIPLRSRKVPRSKPKDASKDEDQGKENQEEQRSPAMSETEGS